MKKLQLALWVCAVVLILPACTRDIPFTIDNSNGKKFTLNIDDDQYVIPAYSQKNIKLSAGLHRISSNILDEKQFMVYATMDKGGLINPTMQDYVILRQPYRNYKLVGEGDNANTEFVLEPLVEGSGHKVRVEYISSQLFIDKKWIYGLHEQLPSVVYEKGVSGLAGTYKSKLFSLEQFVQHVGEDFYQKELADNIKRTGEPINKHYNETDVLALVPDFNSRATVDKLEPLIILGKKYLTADTASMQKELHQELSDHVRFTYNHIDHTNQQERLAWSLTNNFISHLYTSARVMNARELNDTSSYFSLETKQYLNYGVAVLAILVLLVLVRVLYRFVFNSSIEWYDEGAFDNTLRHFALTAACVYDNGIRIDAYKDIGQKEKHAGEHILKSAWTTTNRQELLATLESLRTDTHRSSHNRLASHLNNLDEKEYHECLQSFDKYEKGQAKLLYKQSQYTSRSFMAWDLLRYFFIVHNGMLAGYITVDEFDEFSLPVIDTVQKNYKSWEDFFTQFLLGRKIWKGTESSVSIKSFQNRVDSLLTDQHSPCQKVDWYCQKNTYPSGQASVMSDDIFWTIIDSARDYDVTTFVQHLEGQLSKLSDNDIFPFKAKVDCMIETFSNPVYQYGASIFLPEEVSVYSVLVWLIYHGRNYYEDSLQQPDKVFAAIAKKFMAEYRINDHFITTLENNLHLFTIADSIASSRNVSPLFKTLTYEERRVIFQHSCLNMPIAENLYPTLVSEVSSWAQ